MVDVILFCHIPWIHIMYRTNWTHRFLKHCKPSIVSWRRSLESAELGTSMTAPPFLCQLSCDQGLVPARTHHTHKAALLGSSHLQAQCNVTSKHFPSPVRPTWPQRTTQLDNRTKGASTMKEIGNGDKIPSSCGLTISAPARAERTTWSVPAISWRQLKVLMLVHHHRFSGCSTWYSVPLVQELMV